MEYTNDVILDIKNNNVAKFWTRCVNSFKKHKLITVIVFFTIVFMIIDYILILDFIDVFKKI